MLGLQGKSAKAAPRASFSKSARTSSTMAASTGNGNRSRASSSASERPERLSITSRGPSPYTSKLTKGVTSGSNVTNTNTARRVQSAAATRQRTALGGPTIKASELFRKNLSEPQLVETNTSSTKGNNNSTNIGGGLIGRSGNIKPPKHVRINTERNLSSSSLKGTINVAENLLGIHGTNPFDQGRGSTGSVPSHRRPFSFSSDRSRSVSVTSTDSCSTFENELLPQDGGEADMISWRKDCENNNSNNNRSDFKSVKDSASSGGLQQLERRINKNPQRLSKRTYAMDTGEMDSDQDDNFWNSSPQHDFPSEMIEMKIAEHPDEVLREENMSLRRISQDSVQSQLNRTFTEEEEHKALHSSSGVSEKKSHIVKGSDFDRMLLRQSDNLLQGVDELINEIQSTETSKKLQKISPPSLCKTDSVEKLVADLRNDINKQMVDSSNFSTGNKGESPDYQQLATVDERFNFSTMDLSGIELSDITCPTNVMEQSMPNTGRIDRPLSAVVLGNHNVSNDIISEAETYLLMNRERSRNVQNNINNNNNNNNSNSNCEGFESSSDTNNRASFSSSDALSIIQQQVDHSGEAVSSTSQQSGFDISQEEIQRKICSALKLLEKEDQRVRGGARRGSLTSRPGTSARSQSPYLSVSNPDSRPGSRGGGRSGSESSPRIRSEERNIPYDSYDSHPSKQSSGVGVISNPPNGGRRVLPSEPQSARSCSCLMDHVSSESLSSARSSKTTATIGRIYHSNSETGRCNNQSRIPRQDGRGDGIWETKDDKTKQIFSFLDEVEKSDQEMLFGLRFETDCLGRPKGASTNNLLPTGSSTSETIMTSHLATGKKGPNEDKQFRTMDSLIRKGSVELAREILMLERKLDEAQHAVKLLEESLLNQRELNIRNLRNSERDFKKRMKMQKEEFDQAFTRNEALINEMVTEKRLLQDKFDKLIKNFEDMDEKHKEHTKMMQQKHLDEIKRLRKMQQTAEISLKKNIAGSKVQAQEIRDMTVKGLEPEVQRIIQRHQQEMTEMRAWHADEVREMEERYQRKLHMQLEDLRQKFAKEKEDLVTREREVANRRLAAELKQKDEEIESLKRRHTNEIFEERERAVTEEMKLKDTTQEAVRKAQIKGEVELENAKQDYESKIATLERRHESELKSLKDVYDAERQNWATNQMKKLEQALSEQGTKLKEAFEHSKESEWREKEKKLKEEFEKFRRDEESAAESRFRRLQEKFQTELAEMDKSEKDIKSKFSQAKTDLLAREEEMFSLKTSISMKDKQLIDLQEMNMKMQEERVNLTSVIRREFADQIQILEEECRALKTSIVETQSSCKLQVEQKHLEIDRIVTEKNSEIEKIGLRVKQALGRKDETILELQKQLEKSSFQISHLEELLEEQRKEFVHGMTKMPTGGGRGHRKQ